MECIFAVVSTRFREQLTGGARYHKPEKELSSCSVAPRAQTVARGQSSYITLGRIGQSSSNPGGDGRFTVLVFENFTYQIWGLRIPHCVDFFLTGKKGLGI